jgi:hypothetical protein
VGNVGNYFRGRSITAHEKCGEGFVYGTSFCGLSIMVMCCMCTCRYIPEEWNIGIDKMYGWLILQFKLGILSRGRS